MVFSLLQGLHQAEEHCWAPHGWHNPPAQQKRLLLQDEHILMVVSGTWYLALMLVCNSA